MATSRFTYKSFCQQVDSPTSKSIHLHDQSHFAHTIWVASPTLQYYFTILLYNTKKLKSFQFWKLTSRFTIIIVMFFRRYSTATARLCWTLCLNKWANKLEDHQQDKLVYQKKEKQEDPLDLVTALLKFNCFLSTTVAMHCTFQSNPWWFIDYCRHHITWSTQTVLLHHES